MAVFECVEDVDSYIQNKELVQGAKFVQRNVTQSYASPGNIYCKWFSHSGTLAWNFGFVFAHCMSCRRNRTLDFRLAVHRLSAENSFNDTVTVGRVWQIAHFTKCAARLVKCAHLTNLHTCVAFRGGKVHSVSLTIRSCLKTGPARPGRGI